MDRRGPHGRQGSYTLLSFLFSLIYPNHAHDRSCCCWHEIVSLERGDLVLVYLDHRSIPVRAWCAQGEVAAGWVCGTVARGEVRGDLCARGERAGEDLRRHLQASGDPADGTAYSQLAVVLVDDAQSSAICRAVHEAGTSKRADATHGTLLARAYTGRV